MGGDVAVGMAVPPDAERIAGVESRTKKNGILAVPPSPESGHFYFGYTGSFTLLKSDSLALLILRRYRKGRLCCGNSVC
jgi:hypothetical protein